MKTSHLFEGHRLEAKGWNMASVSAGSHLKRTPDAYRELGLEVYLEEVKPAQCQDCSRCFTESNEIIYRIYTRRTG